MSTLTNKVHNAAVTAFWTAFWVVVITALFLYLFMMPTIGFLWTVGVLR